MPQPLHPASGYLFLWIALSTQFLRGEMVTNHFAASDVLFPNPGQGWFSSSRRPTSQPRLPYGTGYFRFNWDELEPANGQFNWKPLDDVIAAWSNSQARVSIRVMTANAHSKGYYCSPKWLFDLGCQSYDYNRGGGDPMAGGTNIKRIEPDYADPIFLRKHREFIQALGSRYDGSGALEFVDIGSYGIWGEWHTSNGKPWPVRKQIIDMYLEAFTKTPLVQMSDDSEALAYALAHGTGLRRDGVGSPWHETNWIGSKKYAGIANFSEQWKRAPVVFEWFGPYDYMVGKKWSFERAVQFMLDNHVTYINDNIGNVPTEAWPKLEKLARLAGYRFVLDAIAHPREIQPGEELQVQMTWKNVGVGKLYRAHTLTLYLLKPDGTIAASMAQRQIDPAVWLKGEHQAIGAFKIPTDVVADTYGLGIGFVDPGTGRASIHLAIDAPQKGNIYRVSELRISNKTPNQAPLR